MSILSSAGVHGPAPIIYPESDGKPLAESTKQLDWITHLYTNFRTMFADRGDVFVGGDNFWYPIEGDPSQVVAPDVYVVFGRPQHHRGSYKQWLENDVPVTVAFEIRSPSNDENEMAEKYYFYDAHGVEEYYDYDPETNKLRIFVRGLATFRQVHDIANYVSKRMGIRFEMTKPEMTVYGPDGKRFTSHAESQAEARAEREQKEEAKRQASDATRRSIRLAELGRKARKGHATAEELAELERLEDESAPG